MNGPMMLTNPSMVKKTVVGAEGAESDCGKSEMASKTIDAVRSRENGLPASCLLSYTSNQSTAVCSL
jgi:hypothetical protein